MRARYPAIGGGLIDRVISTTDPAWHAARRALGFIFTTREPSVSDLGAQIDAFAETSFEFLRLQARFRKTGVYARSSTDGLSAEVYDDADYMMTTYLDGLLLTYCLWPNHARLLHKFDEEFVQKLPPDAVVGEIGVGHGLMAGLALHERPDVTYRGFDLSRASTLVRWPGVPTSDDQPRSL